MLKENKGITLIALIITIIILLILAVVTIGSIKNSKIITYAQQAATNYNSKKDEEESTILEYESLIEEEMAGVSKEPISKTESFVGYYADVDGNGTPDGIIYADLAFSVSEQLENFYEGSYEYTKKTTLNNYYISQKKCKYKKFKENAVIAPIDKIEENDRFYVMALEDFTTPEYIDEQDSSESYPAYTRYYWYKKALEKMNESDTKIEFGEGMKNTKAIIEIWNKNGEIGGYEGATQEKQDIWKHIQTKVSEGWFIPSRAELGAFVALSIEQGVTTENFEEYGISESAWSSSQGSSAQAWYASFYGGYMGNIGVFNECCVRLSTTF